MSTTTDTEIVQYLARVRAALADLPDDERDDVLEDLESHLAEVLDEVRDDPDGGTLESRLGRPEDYAAELRASAGLAPAVPSRRWQGLRQRTAMLRAHPAVRATLAFLPELRPGWWVLRGVVVAATLVRLLGGGRPLGIFLALLAAPASVWLGRHTAVGDWQVGRRRLAMLTANTALAVTGLVLLANIARTEVVYSVSNVPSYPAPLDGPDGPVTNIYPYAKDGTPLHDVLLYDQNGHPLVLPDQSYDGNGQLIRRYPYGPDGQAIQHAYPQDDAYQDTSTYPPTVRRETAPPVTVPQFATPTTDPGPPPATPQPTATGKARPSATPSAPPSSPHR